MRAAAVEIIPGKLFQRGQFLTWPAKQKQAMLERYGIDVVVNLWSKVDPDLSGGPTYINWPISPTSAPPRGQTIAMLDHLLYLLRSDEAILVHCEAGKGRSVWLVTELLAQYDGIGLREAEDRVRLAVPGASPPTPLWDWRGFTLEPPRAILPS